MANEGSKSGLDKGSEPSVPGSIAEQAVRVAAREVGEAEREMKSDVDQAKVMVTGLSMGALLGLFGLNLLTFAAADALSARMPRWAAKLGLGLAALAGAAGFGLYGWRRRLRDPLWQTRATLRSRLALVLGQR